MSCVLRCRSIWRYWPRCSTWKRCSPPVTALPIGRCKRDDVAQFPIGLADTDWHGMRRHQAWHCLIVALIDTESAYLRRSWTLSMDRTMMCSNPEFGAHHTSEGSPL